MGTLGALGTQGVPTVQPVRQFRSEPCVVLPHIPTITLLGIYPVELKTHPHKNKHINI